LKDKQNEINDLRTDIGYLKSKLASAQQH